MKLYLSIILFICTCTAYAQQKPNTRQQDSLTQQFAQKTGLKKEKAAKLREAYNYRQEELQKLMRDTVMKPALRREEIKKIMSERSIRLNALMTPGLKDTLRKSGVDNEKVMARRLNEMRSRQQVKLSSVPHVSRPGLRKDSINTHPDTKPKTKLN